MYIQRDVESDGTVRFTVSDEDIDHRFEAWTENTSAGHIARVSHRESQQYRGHLTTKEPPTHVYETLLGSDMMHDWLDEVGAAGVKKV